MMTERPNPANIVDSLTWIMDHIEALEEIRRGEIYGPTHAARQLGYSESYFRGRPWRIPEFGFKGRRHTLQEWKSWNDTPEQKRRITWESMPAEKRREAIGAGSS